jgi:hypothetical protein
MSLANEIGWWSRLPERCHPSLPPHRWWQLSLAMGYGINPAAAVELAAIGEP